MSNYLDKADIIAIGDSLYQGVRSLTITAELARNSVPVMIAKALGKPFTAAMPHRPILFDLEAMLRRGGIGQLLTSIRQASIQNVDAWLAEPDWSNEEAFDNIALGGAAIDDLWTNTFTIYWPKIAEVRQRLVDNTGSVATLAKDIGQLWYALNVCFVLNPSLKSGTAQSDASPIMQAGARQPDLLLVNIGSNEGLFRAAFGGNYDNDAEKSLNNIPGKMKELAERLKDALPAHTKICVNSLIRPRFIPNLMPRKNFSDFPGDEYFDHYFARLGDGISSITAERMKQFDEQVSAINQNSFQNMHDVLGDRLIFVDIYTNCSKFDGKHFANRGIFISSTNKRLRNYPIDALFGVFNSGGLSGLDNMHPSVPGYALIAQIVIDALGQNSTIPLDESYAEDSLLNNIPFLLGGFQLEMGLLGSLGILRDTSIGAG